MPIPRTEELGSATARQESIGICLGASTLGFVRLTKEGDQVICREAGRRPHGGNVLQGFSELMAGLPHGDEVLAAVTGRKSRHVVQLASLSEPEAMERALAFIQEQVGTVDAIASMGSETVMVYPVNRHGQIITAITGNKCASGTGEFYLQQMRRMDLTLEQAAELMVLDQPYAVAGRCSVFCKSDCTHALNKGTPKGQVVAGLAQMMAQKILDLTKQQGVQRLLAVGGCSENQALLHYVRQAGVEVVVPQEAGYFEALGAALWALDHPAISQWRADQPLLGQERGSFERLAPLTSFAHRVSFKTLDHGVAGPNDRLILGLDVGSTTTKAVLIRTEDNAMVASVYLRTNGDPVRAARQCYEELLGQLPAPVAIIGLGVTGSGRQIAGLHALTHGVINEIIAHATAAVYFDPDVETILEIGGQDAKYTYITNRVPSDYAMNEACSAGTGSFLEEAAHEALGVSTTEIADRALRGTRPANFSDQCAAFISSDIKTAVQEGVDPNDILAGLVYSICLNYTNRVKGNRPVGQKVFMQGGVCYNRAVPIAMAALTGKEIIVPPEPGLMGAFGVALEVKERQRLGLLAEESFDLAELVRREVSYGRDFICQGGQDACDRKCTIHMIGINDSYYPFGGACNRYANMHTSPQTTVHSPQWKDGESPQEHKSTSPQKRDSRSSASTAHSSQEIPLDLVAYRERLVFDRYASRENRRTPGRRSVGINKSLMTNTLYPLYYHFFTQLGFDVLISREKSPEGIERRGAPFCHPVEISHGQLHQLLSMEPDIVFLPHVKAMPGEESDGERITCPFVQGEPYYLQTSFADILNGKLVLSPMLDLAAGLESAEKPLIAMGRSLGVDEEAARRAFGVAVEQQANCLKEMQQVGQELLARLEKDPSQIVTVVFGRPYNAWTVDANMGIPHKLASRAVRVMPLDFLPLATQESVVSMYWATGQAILKAAELVANHPQLFGVYITNFSCGPDSFLLSFFRRLMGSKPSLTLELDSHTADAGVDTRIEAFLDIVKSFRQLGSAARPAESGQLALAEVVIKAGRAAVHAAGGEVYPLQHPRVKVVIPPLGDGPNRVLAAAFQAVGVQAEALPAPGEEDLKRGKAYASCKECLPLILTVGGLLNYLDRHPEVRDYQLVYFMPTTNGPCRFGQYHVLIHQILEQLGIRNVSMLSLNSDDGYAGMSGVFLLRVWLGILVADVLEDLYSAILVLAEDRTAAQEVYQRISARIVASLAKDSLSRLRQTLVRAAAEFNAIPIKGRLEDTPQVGLVGEIYVRRDGFSRQRLVERLAERGIITKTAPFAEWLYYCDYLVREGLGEKLGWWGRRKAEIVSTGKQWIDRQVQAIFAACRLYQPHHVDIDAQIAAVEHRISPELTGETILTTSAALVEIVDQVEGIISIGPFGCMPSRMCEAMIPKVIEQDKAAHTADPQRLAELLAQVQQLPFLSIESDGSAISPLMEAKLDAFVLQVMRVHGVLRGLEARDARHPATKAPSHE